MVNGSVFFGIYLGFLAKDTVPSLFVGAHWKTVFALGIAVWLGGIVFRMYSIRILRPYRFPRRSHRPGAWRC